MPPGFIMASAPGVTREFKGTTEAALEHPVLGSVIEFIEHHHAGDISSNQLASVAGMSISALERNFRKTFHMTPVLMGSVDDT